MNVLDVITGGAIKSIGEIIDDVVTSVEEKERLKIEIAKVGALERHDIRNTELEKDKETTKRWVSDNENLITRLVRPAVLSWVIVLFSFIMLFDGNIGQFEIKESYIPVIETLLQTLVFAYFGSRGIEKVSKVISNK